MVVYSLSQPRLIFWDFILEEIWTSTEPQKLFNRITSRQLGEPWTIHDGVIFYKNRLYLSPFSPLVSAILAEFYDRMHEGVQKTLHRLHREVFWAGTKATVHAYVHNCPMCQRNKAENLSPAGLLQPLQLPLQVWSDISMDLFDGLPKSMGKMCY